MPKNPLIAPILKVLKSAPQGIQEYDLIVQLESDGVDFSSEELSSQVILFRKHFIVMNALYHLQSQLLAEDMIVNIDPLNIKIQSMPDGNDSSAVSSEADYKVREYYLNWDNYQGTSQQDVDDLLNGFWKQYFAIDKKAEALKVLGIQSEVNLEIVKIAYRKLAALHHPDKGGDPKRFVEIREAYEILLCCF